MAGDWIKWCKKLPDKREVFIMSEHLGGECRDRIAGKLMRLWEWCDENIQESDIDSSGWATLRMASTPDANCAMLDGIVGLPGFANAMRHSGWLKTRGVAITFPNYARNNGSTAKDRARNSLNQQNKRRQEKAVTETSSENSDSSSLLFSSSSDVSSRSEETNGEAPQKPRAKFSYPGEFETFYETYPAKGRKGKKAAFERWKQARARLADMGDESPVETLQRQCEAFAASPKARGFCWNVTTWLNEGHYEDEPAAWEESAPAVKSRKVAEHEALMAHNAAVGARVDEQIRNLRPKRPPEQRRLLADEST